MPYPPTKTPTDCTDVQIYTEPSAEKRLPQISQIYTETFSKKVLCALRILWKFLYTNLEWKICEKQPAHQPSHQYKPKGVQRSPLHRPNNLYKTTQAEALTSACALFSPYVSTDADIRNDRRRHPQRPTQTSVSTDADARNDRRDIRRRNLRLPKNSNSPDQNR